MTLCVLLVPLYTLSVVVFGKCLMTDDGKVVLKLAGVGRTDSGQKVPRASLVIHLSRKYLLSHWYMCSLC